MSFDLFACSWPRPVKELDRRWVSEPDWNAPRMPHLPQPRCGTMEGLACLTLNWREIFSQGLRFHSPRPCGEMRGFHVVFEVRMHDSGTLVFWDDDGSVIRRNGRIVHEDRECHPLIRHEIPVKAGDCLEVAHWQYHGDWIWSARLETPESCAATIELFSEQLPKVLEVLRKPNGPPLKMLCGATSAARTVLCLYSLILNGYSPSGIYVFGEHQWNVHVRKVMAALMPFAQVVPTSNLLETIRNIRPELAGLAHQNWWVMKLCVGLLCQPDEYCLMDDDVFILDRMDDALAEFQRCNLVYAQDADYGDMYRSVWGAEIQSRPFPTGNLNTGLYWLRNQRRREDLASKLVAAQNCKIPGGMWEQGFMAVEYACENVCPLSTQRYFYPYFDGLPGGPSGYDYGSNPCGFVSVHFGGLSEKPSDQVSRMLAAQILGRGRQSRPLGGGNK